MKTFLKASVIAMSVVFLVGCNEGSSNSRAEGAKNQETIMQRAIQSSPTYQPSNFLTREYVNEYMRRMDDVNKLFYIYVLGNNGNMVGYYTGTRPVSVCTLLTPPDIVDERHGTNGRAMVTVSAPQLDGVYSNGGNCDAYFFFDNATDALIEIKGLNFFTSDKPLNVDAEAIGVKSSK